MVGEGKITREGKVVAVWIKVAEEVRTGSQATVAMVADVDVTGTMDVSSDFAIGTTKFKVVESTGAVSMSSDAQTITHSGATSLTISSSQAAAFVKIEGGSSAYVDVESVRFTDDYIGISGDTDK